MIALDRRSAAAVGLAALLPGTVAGAYGPAAGEAVAEGVREVILATREVELATYKHVWMADLVLAPGAVIPAEVVANDRIVIGVEGLVRVRLDMQEFTLKRNVLWAFPKGAVAQLANTGADVAVLRVIDLLPGLQGRR